MIKSNPQGYFDQLDQSKLSLFVDLYELTMAQAIVSDGLNRHDATFSAYFRSMPENRNFLLACGLDTVLDHLENLSFNNEVIEYLNSTGLFSSQFLTWLNKFSFSGNVRGVFEGTPIFPNEPILEVTAPIAEAQIIETFVLNQLNFQTLIASKATRIVEAASGRPVIDFGARRAHGIDAAVKAARASSIAGVLGTSNVLAGKTYQLPLVGTMAHSYIQAHSSEEEAFRAFVRNFPNTTLLVDTYDTIGGVKKITRLVRDLDPEFRIKAIRIDSGNIIESATEARNILNKAGLSDVKIIASGGLDEWSISKIVKSGAPVDSFGVGTRMVVSEDSPGTDIVYKLTSFAGVGRTKCSIGKEILPGEKQVWRNLEGKKGGDLIGTSEETHSGIPLLHQVMTEGNRLEVSRKSIEDSRKYALEEISKLPKDIQAIDSVQSPYPVTISEQLKKIHNDVLLATKV